MELIIAKTFPPQNASRPRQASTLLEKVTDAVRASWTRLGFALGDNAADMKMLADPFERVLDDLRKVLRDLPPAASFQLTRQLDPGPPLPLSGDETAEPKTGMQRNLQGRTAPAFAASFVVPESLGENPFPAADPRHAQWLEFSTVHCGRVARLVIGLRDLLHVVDEATYRTWRSQHPDAPQVYDPERVTSWRGRDGASKILRQKDQNAFVPCKID